MGEEMDLSAGLFKERVWRCWGEGGHQNNPGGRKERDRAFLLASIRGTSHTLSAEESELLAQKGSRKHQPREPDPKLSSYLHLSSQTYRPPYLPPQRQSPLKTFTPFYH